MFFNDALDAVKCAEKQANSNAEAYAVLIARDGFVVMDIENVGHQDRNNEILEVVNPVGICSEMIRESSAKRLEVSFKKSDDYRIERLKKNPLSVAI